MKRENYSGVASDKGSRRNRCTKPCGLGGRWPLPASAKSNARAVALTTVAGSRALVMTHDPPQILVDGYRLQLVAKPYPLLCRWHGHRHRGRIVSAPRCLGPQVAAPLAARETGEGAQLRLCFQGGRAATHSRAARGGIWQWQAAPVFECAGTQLGIGMPCIAQIRFKVQCLLVSRDSHTRTRQCLLQQRCYVLLLIRDFSTV